MKRLLDLILSLLLATTAAPVMIATALLITVRMGPPVLFRQVRPGLEGRPFELLKFRTMRSARRGSGDKELGDSERLTSLGRRLRASSIDELPQLFNVIRGDMSVVGPRPLLMEYLPLFTPEQARRHRVRPGITGLAQVNGRNDLTWEEKFEMDVWYVDNRSLWLDLKILALTFARVVRQEGVSRRGHATTEKFRGSRR